MRFRRQQDEARAATLRLLLLFALLLLAVVVAVNLALAGLYSLLSLGGLAYPPLFFETNTAVVLLFVLGGCAVEAGRLRDAGGARVALAVGGREIVEARDLAERRLLNVLDEMALASGLPRPTPFVLEHEPGINAFVAGWGHGDDGRERRGPIVLGVTRGALECLTRDELQGLVAHELGHIKAGDLRLQMWLLALVWGLSLVHGYGRRLGEPDDQGRPNLPGLLFGAVFVVLGWLGWLAGRVLQAAVSRQREFGADAYAVQFTRSRDGLGGTLRKIRFQSEIEHTGLQHPQAQLLAAMLLHAPARSRWLATHPPLAERIKRVCGRELPPLPAQPIDLQAEAGQLGNTQASGQSTLDSRVAGGEDAPDHPWAESPAATPATPLLQAAAMTLDVNSRPP
ncbi:MAG TPA: M48 family metalloprotease, partial [Methylibium sp.]